MLERAEIVSALLRMSHRIVVSEAFVRDTAVRAAATHRAGDHDAAAALRAAVAARKDEVARMRAVMAKLAAALAEIPIDAD